VSAALQVLLLTAPADGQETTRVSVDSSGAQGNHHSTSPKTSADGQVVAFYSYASNLVAGDTNGTWDVFVHDRSTGITERVSVDSSGAEGNGDSYTQSISADGQVVAFMSYASNLISGDTNGVPDVFVHDRSTGITERVSVDSSGAEGNGDSYTQSISADGQIVAFSSYASNLVAGDTNGDSDVFVHDRSTGITERVSVESSGNQANGHSYDSAISADGQIVAFRSEASNLVAGDTNGTWDVFVHDRSTGITERVSVDSSGTEGNGDSHEPSISADGQIVAFWSYATNLVTGDANGYADIFVHERCEIATWTNYGAGFPGTNGVPSFTSQADPVLGTTVTLDLANSYGNSTIGVVLVGYQETLVSTDKGGDLLVVIVFVIPVPLGPGGVSIVGDLSADDALCGFEFFLQALELDPGAAKRMSFTAGLKLVLGH
jgi:cold shock CspA family protein